MPFGGSICIMLAHGCARCARPCAALRGCERAPCTAHLVRTHWPAIGYCNQRFRAQLYEL